jgi:hypothetical protein
MIRLTTASLNRFGFATTLKLMLMLAIVVGCLMAAALSGPTAAEPKPAMLCRVGADVCLQVVR